MSGGTMGGLPVAYGRFEYGAFAFAAAVIAGMVGGGIWFVQSQSADFRARSDRAYAAAPFHTGDIVRARVGGFRGVVIAISCFDSCNYQVRFPTATMQPQWVDATEIEAAP